MVEEHWVIWGSLPNVSGVLALICWLLSVLQEGSINIYNSKCAFVWEISDSCHVQQFSDWYGKNFLKGLASTNNYIFVCFTFDSY